MFTGATHATCKNPAETIELRVFPQVPQAKAPLRKLPAAI
jgi:hypothetical protein